MIPWQCDLCLTAMANNADSVELHVREQIEQFNARHSISAPSRTGTRRHNLRKRGRAAAVRSGEQARAVAPKRQHVISPVFGHAFDPKRGRDQASNAVPAHLR